MEVTSIKHTKKDANVEDDEFSIDAIKMKNDIQAQMYEELNGDLSLENFRRLHKKSIEEGRITQYTIEEYEERCRIADANSKIPEF